MDTTARQFIDSAAFFREMGRESREAVARIAVPKRFSRRDLIFREGDPGIAVHLLARGTVQLSKAGHDGREIVVKTVRAGEVFAEVILFEETLYPVRAVALTDGVLLLMHRRDMHELLRREDFRNDFIAMLMRKQRYLGNRIRDLALYDLEERLFRFLEEQYGAARRIQCPIPKKDVAAAIGTTPESLSRLLSRLAAENRLHWHNQQITRP